MHKKYKYVVTILIIVFVFLILGIIMVKRLPESKETYKNNKSTGSCVYIKNQNSWGAFAAEDGFYFRAANYMMRYDYETGETSYICARPECSHQPWDEATAMDERCDAYWPSEIGALVVYGESLYFFETESAEQKVTLIKSDLNRENQKEICEFQNEFFLPMVLKENILYFSSIESIPDPDDPNAPRKSETAIFALDLDTDELTTLFEQEARYSSTITLLGEYENKLYYCYDYCDNGFNGYNVDEVNAYSEIYEFDLAENTPVKLELQIQRNNVFKGYICKNSLVFYTRPLGDNTSVVDIFTYNLETGELNESGEKAETVIQYMDDKLIYQDEQGNIGYYDNDMKEFISPDEKIDTTFYILEESDEYFIGTRVSAENELEICIIKKEDYWSGKNNYESPVVIEL